MPWRRIVHEGDEIADTPTLYLTFGERLTEGGAVVKSITLNNYAATEQEVTVYLVAAGSSPSESNVIIRKILDANEHVVLNGPWWNDSEAEVHAVAETADSVNIRITAMEEFQAGGA